MNTIFKYPIRVTDRQEVKLPMGSIILSAQFQSGRLCLWANVETDADEKIYTIEIFGTGHTIDGNIRRYIATVQQGPLVWHIFIRS